MPETKPATKTKSQLIAEMRQIGFDWQKASGALPDWSLEALNEPTGLFEVQGYIAKYFGLAVDPTGRLCRRDLPAARFKTAKHTALSKVAAAQALASSICSVVAAAIVRPYTGLGPRAALELREAILQGGARSVGLNELLEVCWGSGIPVIYLPELPITGSKMDGMVLMTRARPAIFISKSRDVPAWVLFVLAHEIGHLALGHLPAQEGSSIVDETVDEGTVTIDEQEQDANRYATKLLVGEKPIITIKAVTNATDMAVAARRFGAAHHVDPGHVLLNAAKNSTINGKPAYALAQAALKHIESAGAASEACRTALRANIDLDGLSDNEHQFLAGLKII
jgi:Zn-dependent peptidase ImmA (M78 family)